MADEGRDTSEEVEDMLWSGHDASRPVMQLVLFDELEHPELANGKQLVGRRSATKGWMTSFLQGRIGDTKDHPTHIR